MKQIISAGLVLVAVGCGQVAPGDSPAPMAAVQGIASGPAAAVVQQATPPAVIPAMQTGGPKGCSTDLVAAPGTNGVTLSEQMPERRADEFYRKNGDEAAARKEAALAKMPVDQERAPLPPVDPRVLELQAQYLAELEVLRAKHHHQETDAFERERTALKERLLGD